MGRGSALSNLVSFGQGRVDEATILDTRAIDEML